MIHGRVVIVLHLYLLEPSLNPILRILVKTCNVVTFYEFLIHLGVHHTSCYKWYMALLGYAVQTMEMGAFIVTGGGR
jgi:hypothetical protein